MMDQAFQPNLDFAAVDDADAAEAFVVDLEGYEGPLHVLLALARTQKVDLLKLSITKLAEQYWPSFTRRGGATSPWRRTIW